MKAHSPLSVAGDVGYGQQWNLERVLQEQPVPAWGYLGSPIHLRAGGDAARALREELRPLLQQKLFPGEVILPLKGKGR